MGDYHYGYLTYGYSLNQGGIDDEISIILFRLNQGMELKRGNSWLI